MRTIGVLAHVDAGKTTLSEAILFLGGAVRSRGRVDRGDTLLDHSEVERRRGITIYADQADFQFEGVDYTLIDTPGHSDLAPEAERVLPALDAAILVVSAADGIRSHTRTLWALLRKLAIPTALFVNKCDLPAAEPAAVRRQLEEAFGATDAEAWREFAAETDDALLEAYLSGTADDARLLDAAANAFSESRFFPVYSGCALTGEGVDAMLRGLNAFLREAYDPDAPLKALCYKVRRNEKGGRTEFLKILSGTLRAKDTVGEEKVHELRRQEGGRAFPLDAAPAGVCCVTTGLTRLRPGQYVGEESAAREIALRPLLQCGVACDDVSDTELMEKLSILVDEEPTLRAVWQAQRKQAVLHVSGMIQMEILQETLKERFGLNVRFEDVRVEYMETVAEPVRGCGHYEPLRHYAEVHLLLSPLPPGSGIVFESLCPTDDLAPHWQRLIETHVLEKQHVGALTGSPLTDVKISLLAGRSHVKHTEGGDFRQAVYRAIRQALFSGRNILLEPVLRFALRAEAGLVGKLMTQLQARHCEAEPPVTLGETILLRGTGPASELLPFGRELTALTHGRGMLELAFERYAPCHDAEKVIAEIGYDREQDISNPASSVFCEHGAGVTVGWREAPARMHIQIKEKYST
ncbi:MAG: GTP-binding protein [Oscillospiraceae bacterium]|nr:GTP-binding protein [Oscillospiraceae bacterium]